MDKAGTKRVSGRVHGLYDFIKQHMARLTVEVPGIKTLAIKLKD